MSKIKVCIDPGHGGKDRANKGRCGYVEADGMLRLSQLLKDELEATGAFSIQLTRNIDKTLGLTERAKMAVNFGAELFISQHTNANGGGGTEVFYSVDLPKDISLARDMSKAISTAFSVPNRGAKTHESKKYPGEDYYTVIDAAQDRGIPHILLIENLFHDNIREEKMLLNDANLKKLAKIQGEVICDFFSVKSSNPRIEQYKNVIQSKCKFSDPEAVWDLLDQHKYAEALYKRFFDAMS